MTEPTQVSAETKMYGAPHILSEYMDVDDPFKDACARAAQDYMIGTINDHGFRSDFSWNAEDRLATIVLTIHGFDAENDPEDWSFHIDLGELVENRAGEGETDPEVRSENSALAASLRDLADILDG